MVRLVIGGGVGEHGRNCFLLEGKQIKILLDAGVSGDAKAPYPHLTSQQVQDCNYLFLSHSHKDHSGAIQYFYQLGFHGTILTSYATVNQLVPLTLSVQVLEELNKENKWFSLSDELSFCWGYSGHCEGSVWFFIQLEDRSILYSGDYHEQNQPYPCTPIRNKQADLALLDCAYGTETKSKEDYLTEFYQLCNAHLLAQRSLLLPVPIHGRGVSLFHLFRQWFPNLKIALVSSVDSAANSDFDILLIKDAQLQKEVHQQLALQWIQQNKVLLFTGECDQSSFAYSLLHSNQALFQRYPVHMNYADSTALMKVNNFKKVVFFHSSQFNHVMEDGGTIKIEKQSVMV